MKNWLVHSRNHQLVVLGAMALVAVMLAEISLRRPGAPDERREIGQVVEPELADHIPDLGLIMVTTSSETYHLVRNPDGWVLSEKGDYPVSEARIVQLAEAAASMKYDQAMTRDERKFDMIGLGDPLSGGTGALLELGDGRGDVFARMIIGYRSGRSYVRVPDDLQAWAVAVEDMPPLQRSTTWLDLDPLKIERTEIRDTTVQPLVGAAYTLRSVDSVGEAFEIAPPFDDMRVLVPYSLSIVGTATSSFNPADVAPSAALRAGASLGGVHTTRLKDGAVIETTAWRAPDRGWVTLKARAETGASAEGVERAANINEAAEGWAYALTETDWEAFTSPLALLAVEN